MPPSRPERPSNARRPPPGLIPTGPLCGHPKRPRTDRTRAIDLAQLTNLANAFAFAERQSLSLNAGLVLTWRHSELYDGGDTNSWSELQTAVLDHAARLLGRLGVKTAYLWTRERANGHGAHTHVLLHLGRKPLPAGRALEAELRRKFRFAPQGVCLVLGGYGMLTPQMRAGQFRYVVKGFDHQAFRYTGVGGETEGLAAALGIEDYGPQGVVAIKRCGTSQNIGPAARRAAGWREVRGLEGLRRVLHPDRVLGDLVL